MKLLQALIISCCLSVPSISVVAEENNIQQSANIMLPVNINQADLEELKTLKGIGTTKAQAIISYRQTYGDFQVVDELLDVKGIGEKLLEQNRSRIKI